VLFVWWELRSPAPLLDPRLFRLDGFATGSTSLFLEFFALYGFFFVALQFLQLRRSRRGDPCNCPRGRRVMAGGWNEHQDKHLEQNELSHTPRTGLPHLSTGNENRAREHFGNIPGGSKRSAPLRRGRRP
jgi:hypothetical protein